MKICLKGPASCRRHAASQLISVGKLRKHALQHVVLPLLLSYRQSTMPLMHHDLRISRHHGSSLLGHAGQLLRRHNAQSLKCLLKVVRQGRLQHQFPPAPRMGYPHSHRMQQLSRRKRHLQMYVSPFTYIQLRLLSLCSSLKL